MRSTCFDITFQTFGYRRISTGVFLPAAEYSQSGPADRSEPDGNLLILEGALWKPRPSVF